MARDMRDLIIVLPGITGSVLQQNGKDVWAPSIRAITQFIRSRLRSMEHLMLEHDDPVRDDIGDGVVATKIMDDIVIIPGFWRIDGYTGLRQRILDRFNVTHSKPNGNYYEFPYDWRRDNRYSARRLERFAAEKLQAWRAESGNDDARLILIGHSMGGLISRYYLEVLGGWQNCRALYAIGSPHSGSVNALDALSNGISKLGIDVSPILRSYTSVYQLLPTYAMLDEGNDSIRVTETNNIPHISQEQAKTGTSFLDEIVAAMEQNRQLDTYRDEGYKFSAIVGTGQDTLQSASLSRGQLLVSNQAPEWMPSGINDGDGTVPLVSAIPHEYADEQRGTFENGKHAALQNNGSVLDQLLHHLTLSQIDLHQFLGTRPDVGLDTGRPILKVNLPDLIESGTPLAIQASLANVDSDNVTLYADLDSASFDTSISLTQDNGRWHGQVDNLPPGYYRVSVSTNRTDINTVTDVLAVAEGE